MAMNGAADGCGSAEDAVDLGPIDGLRMGASYRRHDNAASAEKLNNTTVMVLRDPGTNASVLSFDLKTAGPNGPAKPTPITRCKFVDTDDVLFLWQRSRSPRYRSSAGRTTLPPTGWLLHKTKGGLVAGTPFVLPGFIAIMP